MNQDKMGASPTPWGANAPHRTEYATPPPTSATTTTQPRRRVMVCLDRSPRAEVCVPYAGFMARALHAELTILHVLPWQAAADPATLDVLGWEISRREAEQYLARMRESVEAGGLAPEMVRAELAQGQPAERVLSLERELQTDLTVLARRGEGGKTEWNLGATAQRVLMNASGSVLVLPSDPPPPVVPPTRILVPLDGSQRAESVLPLVIETAAAQGAAVVLLHVVSEPRPSGVLADADNLRLAGELAARLQTAAEAYLAGVRERILGDLLRVQVRVLRRADTREALLDVARDEKADLIVLSAHGNTCNGDHPFGSVTSHALAHATLPVLVVQDLRKADRTRSDRPPASAGRDAAPRSSLSSRPEAR